MAWKILDVLATVVVASMAVCALAPTLYYLF